jgi:hypothetical protein
VAIRVAGAGGHASGVPRYAGVLRLCGAGARGVARNGAVLQGLTVCGDVEGGPGPALRTSGGRSRASGWRWAMSAGRWRSSTRRSTASARHSAATGIHSRASAGQWRGTAGHSPPSGGHSRLNGKHSPSSEKQSSATVFHSSMRAIRVPGKEKPGRWNAARGRAKAGRVARRGERRVDQASGAAAAGAERVQRAPSSLRTAFRPSSLPDTFSRA